MARSDIPPGFAQAMRYPLFEALLHRRTRRVARGVPSVRAGSLSYTSSHEPQPLDPLEEAVLIAAIGLTGRVTPPDRPFQDDDGKDILGSPNHFFRGRAAASADNGHMTHFFMMNDGGIYYLDHERGGDAPLELTPESMLANAERVKVKIADRRLELPRRYPYYLDSNRFLSNVPGSTLFIPVVDSTMHFINMFMYVAEFPEGQRPVYVDELNGYQPLCSQRWIDSGFLNPKLKLPLAATQRFRTDVEVHLLLQNLSLAAQALGLGGWIHASFPARFLLGHPDYTTPDQRGLGFRWVIPERSPLPGAEPRLLAQPVGLDGHIEGLCPPYHASMSAAVDAYVEMKFAEDRGVYRDRAVLDRIFKDGLAERYIAECPPYSQQAIDCAKDICERIHEVHGRFPPPLSGMDAIHAPGIWFQAHHNDLDYYDQLFRDGYSDTQRQHEELWHAKK